MSESYVNFRIRALSLFLLACSMFMTARAQGSLSDDRFFFDYSVGGLFQLNAPLKVDSRFSLSDFHKNNPCVTLGAKCFWNKSWGVQMQFMMNAYADNLLEEVRVLEDNRVEGTRGMIGGSFGIGPVYRYILGKCSIQPYCNVGLSVFFDSEYSTSIEHIGSNDIDSFTMKAEKTNRKSFCVIPGVQVARHLSKRLYLYGELSYLFNTGSSVGEYAVHNLYTQELIEKKRFKEPYTDALLLRLGINVRLF